MGVSSKSLKKCVTSETFFFIFFLNFQENMVCVSNNARILMHRLGLHESVIVSVRCFVSVEDVIRHVERETPEQLTLHSNDHLPTLFSMVLKKKLRPYQEYVLSRMMAGGFRPSLLTMPCGSGKTLVGCAVMSALCRRTLVITNYKIVAKQWYREMLQCFDHTARVCYDTDVELSDADVIITTYDSLACNQTVSCQRRLYHLLMSDFGLIILDEAHKVVAPTFFAIISRLRGPFLALSASPIREDNAMRNLYPLVGGNKIGVSRLQLVEEGHICDTICRNIIVSTDSRLLNQSLGRDMLTRCMVLNPAKMAVLYELLVDEGHRTMVFCDNIWCLHHVYDTLRNAFGERVLGPICMSTTMQQRESFIASFMSRESSIMMISRTGDEGIDIPNASRLIQICTIWGSRRQHLQRIGRVQRCCSSKKTTVEAISILSEGTSEIQFAEHRDAYLRFHEFHVHTEKRVSETSDAQINSVLSVIRKRKL